MTLGFAGSKFQRGTRAAFRRRRASKKSSKNHEETFHDGRFDRQQLKKKCSPVKQKVSVHFVSRLETLPEVNRSSP